MEKLLAWAKAGENILLSSSKDYHKSHRRFLQHSKFFMSYRFCITIMDLAYAPLNYPKPPITIDSPMQNPKNKNKK